MKMKNKILGILIALVVMIGVMASQVNAATISASSTEVNKGDRVTVTVNLNDATPYIDIDLKYNPNSFEYVDKSATSDLPSLTVNNKAGEGIVLVSAADATETTKYISFTFTAKENTDAAEFVASGLNTITGEKLDVSSVSVAVVEKAEEPTPEEPTNPENPGDQGDVETPSTDTPVDTTVDEENGSKTNTESQKVDENGNVITKLPQTGTSIVTVAGVIAAVVVVAAIAVRKLRK